MKLKVASLQFVLTYGRICHTSHTTSSEVIHDRLCWPSVKERMFTTTICAFHKIVTTKEPKCMYDNLRNINTAHRHNTRLSLRGGYVQPKPRTNSLTRTFQYRCIKTYNTLPTSITTKNQEVFKTKLREWVKAQKDKNQPLTSWW